MTVASRREYIAKTKSGTFMIQPERDKAAAYITPDVVRRVLLDMIDIRSPTGSEAGMADYIVERLRRCGLDAYRQPVEEGRPNAVAH